MADHGPAGLGEAHPDTHPNVEITWSSAAVLKCSWEARSVKWGVCYYEFFPFLVPLKNISVLRSQKNRIFLDLNLKNLLLPL